MAAIDIVHKNGNWSVGPCDLNVKKGEKVTFHLSDAVKDVSFAKLRIDPGVDPVPPFLAEPADGAPRNHFAMDLGHERELQIAHNADHGSHGYRELEVEISFGDPSSRSIQVYCESDSSEDGARKRRPRMILQTVETMAHEQRQMSREQS